MFSRIAVFCSLFALLLNTNNALGFDNLGEREFLYAILAKQHDVKVPLPFLTQVSLLDKTPGIIQSADGRGIMYSPRVVSSGYDSSVKYDVSRFYKSDKIRLNMMIQYAGRIAGEIFSAGLDTGHHAQKIKIEPAFFVGYARAFQMTERASVTLGFGGWFGGTISEKPCIDYYDREYYCGTLTAWTDYKPVKNRLDKYVKAVWSYAL